MISLHSIEVEDWSGNGICGLFPDMCSIKKVAAGQYDLELEHPITDDGRALAIQNGMIIKAPVPARETPLIQISAQGHAGQAQHDIWKVKASTTSLWSKPKGQYSSWSSTVTYSVGARVRYSGRSYAAVVPVTGVPPTSGGWKTISSPTSALQKLKQNDELVYHGAKDDTWSQVTTSKGLTGYIKTADAEFLRTESYIPALPSYQTVVLPRQVKEQLFRVYSVNTDTETNKVKVLARHISYGQMRNFVKSFNPNDMQLQTALDAMSADLINEHDFHYYTNISRSITATWALKNGVSVILDPDEGAASKMKAQVVRDNFDTFLLENVEIDRGVVIESGKNLLGLTCDVNDDKVVTRIMPYGTDKDGKMLLLPEVYIDSPYLLNYPEIRSIPLQVQDAVERAASGDTPAVTKEQCYEKMRATVQAEYDAGADLPDFDITVKFIQLGDTEEYKALKDLQQIFLYDTVTVKHGPLGLLYKVQMIGYTFDSVLERYDSVTFGNIKSGADLGKIAGFQLPPAGISGTKLVPGTVGSMQLRELSVLAAHIGLAQIVNAHIQDATIDKAKIKDFVAEVATIAVAKIGDAWIDEAWIGQLSAKVVEIVEANIGTLIVENASIDWAQIANLTAAVADIVTANIETANIGWAQIKGLVANTALFTQGATGKLYCAELMVTDANIENLSANKIAGGIATFGKLMLMGPDGKLYEINVGSLGEITASEKQLDGDNVGDYVLTDRNLADGTLTARTLNVEDIFANSALVRQLIAQSIDTDALFANEAYVNALKTNLIESDIGAFLNLESNTGIQAMVTEAIDEGAYKRVAGIGIDANGVNILGKAVRMITQLLYISNDENEATAALIIDMVDKIVRANSMQIKGLHLEGTLSGINNVMLKGSLSVINVPAGSLLNAIETGIARYAEYDLTINVATGTYNLDNFIARNHTGGRIKWAFAAGVILNVASIEILDNPSGVSWVGNSASPTQINTSSSETGIVVKRSPGEFANLRITGRARTGAADGLARGMYFEECNGLYIHGNIIERTRLYTMFLERCSGIWIIDNIGGYSAGNYTTLANLGEGIACIHSYGSAQNTVPVAATNAAFAWLGDVKTYNITQAASPGAPSTPATQTFKYVYNSSAYCDLPSSAGMGSAASSWPSGAPRSGLYSSQSKRYAGLWLLKLEGGAVQNILTGLAGKTILAANLTVHCDTYNGSAGTTQDLYYMLHNVLPPNGTSPGSRLTDTGYNLSPADGTSQTLNLTAWLQSMVNAGTPFYGFGLGTNGTYARYDMTCTFEITYQV